MTSLIVLTGLFAASAVLPSPVEQSKPSVPKSMEDIVPTDSTCRSAINAYVGSKPYVIEVMRAPDKTWGGTWLVTLPDPQSRFGTTSKFFVDQRAQKINACNVVEGLEDLLNRHEKPAAK